MFNSQDEANTRYARAAGRIVFGVVLILGAATVVERVMRVDHPGAAKTLAIIWLAAMVSGWVFAKLAAATSRRIDVRDIFTLSYVLPAIGIALLLPLTLHIPVAIAIGELQSFDSWTQLSLAITGPAHIAFAVLAAVRAARLARGEPAMSSTKLYLVVVVVSAIPFAVMMFIPPLVVGVTGICIIPLVQRMRPLIERERGAYELPAAIVVA